MVDVDDPQGATRSEQRGRRKGLGEQAWKFSDDDQMRGLWMVGSYVDLFYKYAEDCDAILKSFGDKYGYSGTTYDTLFKAGLKDGHSTGTQAAIDYLKRHGVAAETRPA